MHADLEPPTVNLARLLRELPADPAPYGYQEFERRALARERAGRRRGAGPRLAAAAVCGVGLVAMLVRLGGGAPQSAHPVLPGAVIPQRAPGPEDETLPPRAGAAERWLASLPREPVVVHVGTRAAVMGIEDRIAQVDDLLSGAREEPARLAVLQQERARLVGTLVQVRYAETLASELP